MSKPALALASLLALAVSCAGPRTLPERVAAAHGGDLYAVPAVSADVRLVHGGDLVLEGRLVFEPSTGKSRLELADGTVAVFDGEAAWVAPADAELPRARFHLLTWPYFLAAPWKLGDPGSTLEPLGERVLAGEAYEAARLTFEDGVGDTPDDWYVVYAEPDTSRLHALAYIVTYGTSVEEASADPHAVTYDELATAGGLRFPARLTLYPWSAEEGLAGDPLGVATFSGHDVAPAPAGAFARPESSRRDPLPAE